MKDIDNVLEDLKVQMGASKENLLNSVRNLYAKALTSSLAQRQNFSRRDDTERLPIIQSFYFKLFEDLSDDEKKAENKALEELIAKYTQKIKEEDEEERQSELEEQEEQENRVKNVDLKHYESLRNKVLFFPSSVSADFYKIPYVDKNGYIDVSDMLVSVNTFASDLNILENLKPFEDVFSDKDFVGKVYESDYDECICLFKNEEYTFTASKVGMDNYYVSLSPTKNFEKSYHLIDKMDEQYERIISENSTIAAATEHISEKLDKKYQRGYMETIKYTLASYIAKQNGKYAFPMDSDFEEALKNQVAQKIIEADFRQRGASKEEIDAFFDSVEQEAIVRMKNYDQEQIDRTESKKESLKENEIKIAETVKSRLKQGALVKVEESKDFFVSAKKPKKLSHRKKIELSDSVFDIVLKLSEGNIGAISVLGKMLNLDITEEMSEQEKTNVQFKNMMSILGLDDMNIRGPQIWMLFKDVCRVDVDDHSKESMKAFKEVVEKIENRDRDLVDQLNELSKKYGYKDKAVTSGASYIIGEGHDASELYFTEGELQEEPILETTTNAPEKLVKPSKIGFTKKLRQILSKETKQDTSTDDENDL